MLKIIFLKLHVYIHSDNPIPIPKDNCLITVSVIRINFIMRKDEYKPSKTRYWTRGIFSCFTNKMVFVK